MTVLYLDYYFIINIIVTVTVIVIVKRTFTSELKTIVILFYSYPDTNWLTHSI